MSTSNLSDPAPVFADRAEIPSPSPAESTLDPEDDDAAAVHPLRVAPTVLASRVAAARLRVDSNRRPPDRLIPPGRRADRGPELPMAHETFRFLGHQARESPGRSKLVAPMRRLMQQTSGEAVRVFLREMHIDAFDIWIAYHLLATREQSARGRDACSWLALTLGRALRTHHAYSRDKTGAVMLWSVLHHLHRGTQMFHMYRIAMTLILPGVDRFTLSEVGPAPLRALADAASPDATRAVFDLLDRDGPGAETLAEALRRRLQNRDDRKGVLRARLDRMHEPPLRQEADEAATPAITDSQEGPDFTDNDGFEDDPDERVKAWFSRSTMFRPDSL